MQTDKLTKYALFVFTYYLLKYLYYLYTLTTLSSSIYFLNVGQGDAILITGERHTSLLIDGGPGYTVDTYFNSMFPFKRCPIDVFLLTHPHNDHIEGIVRLLHRCNHSVVIFNPVKYSSNILSELEFLLSSNGNDYIQMYKGSGFRIDSFNFYTVWPSKDFYNGDINDSSITLLLDYVKYEALFTGDIGNHIFSRLDNDLLNKYIDSNLDLIKSAHHGARNGYNASFYQLYLPSTCPISVGENSYGHPARDVISELESLGCKVIRTDSQVPLLFR